MYLQTNNFQFIVPTSLAANTSDIESFRIEMDFLGFRNSSNTQSSNVCIFLQPMSALDTRITLGTQSWNWLQVAQYQSSNSGFTRQSIGASGDSNEGTWSPSGGSYYGKDYGLAVGGPSSNYLTGGADYYSGPEQNFISTDPLSQWRSGITGQIKFIIKFMHLDFNLIILELVQLVQVNGVMLIQLLMVMQVIDKAVNPIIIQLQENTLEDIEYGFFLIIIVKEIAGY